MFSCWLSLTYKLAIRPYNLLFYVNLLVATLMYFFNVNSSSYTNAEFEPKKPPPNSFNLSKISQGPLNKLLHELKLISTIRLKRYKDGEMIETPGSSLRKLGVI